MTRFHNIVRAGFTKNGESYLIDMETGVLTQFADEQLINQQIFTLRQAQCLFLLSEHYPYPLRYEEMLAWYFDKDQETAARRYAIAKQNRRKRALVMKALWRFTSEFRLLLHPLGLTIASRSYVGYELQRVEYETQDERGRFTALPLPDVLPPEHQLVLDTQTRTLTLFFGKIVIEQCILPKQNQEFFTLLAHNYPHPTLYEELFACYYEESADDAHKRIAYARKDKRKFDQVSRPIRDVVKALRPRLKVFGIAVHTLPGFGYAFGSTPRFQFDHIVRPARPRDVAKNRREYRHEVQILSAGEGSRV